MSPKNLVLPLNFLSLKSISTILIHSLSDDEGLNYKTVEEYLLNATYEVLHDLLKMILNMEYLDASTRFSCLEIILRKDIRRLDTGLFPHSYYEKILNVIGRKGVGLQHLNLKGIWLRDYPYQLAELLGKLKNLTVLIIPHMPDDKVLKAAFNCPNLTVLDISGECNFSMEGASQIQSEKLKVLNVGMYGKKNICVDEGVESDNYVDVVINLIKNLPNLNVLKTYSYIGRALLKIYEKERNYKTKLKYVHDTNTTIEMLNAIAHLCPNLECVNFNSPCKNVLNNLAILKRLNSLKISEPNVDELLYYLQVSGSKLQVLKLNVLRRGGADGDETRSLDLSQISLFVPELTTFECYKSNLAMSTLHIDNYFIHLQSLEILYCNIGENVLIYMLHNSPSLRRIVVGGGDGAGIVRLTDGDIFRLCAECDFLCLEELWFSCARSLTVTSVELLMGHCPNLKVLGQLTGWDITQSDLDYLKAVILSSNTDLTLLPLEY